MNLASLRESGGSVILEPRKTRKGTEGAWPTFRVRPCFPWFSLALRALGGGPNLGEQVSGPPPARRSVERRAFGDLWAGFALQAAGREGPAGGGEGGVEAAAQHHPDG